MVSPPVIETEPSRLGLWDFLLAAILTLIAAAPRFSQLDQMEFKLDEVRLHAAALATASGKPPRVGIISSLGVPNPPMAVYLFALPALLSRDPVVVAGFAALGGSIAAGLTYLIGARYLTRGVGLAAALVVALSPWGVILSRKIWAQDLLAPLACGFIWLLLEVARRGRAAAALFLPIIASALIQTHPSAIILAPVVATALLLPPARPSWRWSLGGVAIGLALWIPFLTFLAQVGPAQYWARAREVPRMLSPSQMAPRAGQHFVEFVSGGSMIDYVADRPISEFLKQPTDRGGAFWWAAALLLAGSIAALVGPRRGSGRWIVAIAALMLAGFTFGAHQPQPHYFALALPIGALLAAMATDFVDVARTRGKTLVMLAAPTVLLAPVLASDVSELDRFHRELGRVRWRGDHGPPYADSQAAAAFVLDWINMNSGQRPAIAPTPASVAVHYLIERAGVSLPPLSHSSGRGAILWIEDDPAAYPANLSSLASWRSESGGLEARIVSRDAVAPAR